MTFLQILIADDHEPVRRGLRALIESRPDWNVCGEAADGRAAVEKAKELKPNVAILDVSMPVMNGLDAARLIRKENPGCKILIVSQNDPAGMDKAAAEAGAGSFVPKSRLSQDLVGAIDALVQDGAAGVRGIADKQSRIGGEAEDLERQLRLDVEMLAAIVASSDDAIISKNLDGVITTWNDGAQRIFGYTREEAIGQYITLIIPSDRQHEESEILRRVRSGQRVDHFETVRRRKDGSTLDISVTISPLRDSTGAVVGASKVARDISKQKRAEQALRESEGRLRALVNASAYVVYRMSPDWKVMQRLDGKGIISDAGNSTEDWLHDIHPEDRPLVLQAIQQSLRTRSPFELEYRVKRADGSAGWTLSRAVPRLDADGEIIEWFGAASDVTRRKQAEEDYRKLVETLDAEVRARTREVEERNADVLRQSEQLRELSWRLLRTQDEERRYIARELHDSAGQTLTVLGMNLAQLVHKTGRKAPELVGDAEMIQETVQQLQREIRTASYLLHPPLLDESGISSALNWYTQGLIERSGLEITLDISEDFGRLPGDMELLVFRLVQECLTNIHRHSGSKTAKIRMVREGDLLTLNVQDQGKGMSPARLAEVHSQGSGVGIRGMRERLRQFRGTLSIESDGSGTRILVTIPIPKTSVPKDDGAIPLQASLQTSGARIPGLSEF